MLAYQYEDAVKAKLWKKILANVLNITLESPACEQGPGMGGAMLAMVADGKYGSVQEVCDRFISVASVVAPDPELVKKYENRYQKFKEIYPACKQLFAALQ